MKTSHSIVFFVLILVLAAGIFLFIDDKRVDNQPDIVKYEVACDNGKVDSKIFNLDGNTKEIGALMSVNKMPLSDEDKSLIRDLGVYLDDNSWIFEYVYVKIPTRSLCDLAELDFVTKIWCPEGECEDDNISKL